MDDNPVAPQVEYGVTPTEVMASMSGSTSGMGGKEQPHVTSARTGVSKRASGAAAACVAFQRGLGGASIIIAGAGSRFARHTFNKVPMTKLQDDPHTLGIISDTHGLVRPEAIKALEGVEMIIHAGDIGTPEVLEALRAIAPVAAVRGNNDKGEWAHALPETEVVEVGGVALYVLHDVKTLDLDPVTAGFRAVISGHSHQPAIAHRRGVLFLNPGSAGPRRFKLPISVARLIIRGDTLEAQLVELAV
jgi:uncharacterized protein